MASNEEKIAIKIALAEKYERKGRLTKSTPKLRQCAYKAARYRRQAAQLAHPGGGSQG